MEIKIQRTSLQRGLYLTHSVIENKSTMPLLANVHLETKGKSLLFTSTDLQVGMVCREPADVIAPGKILVSAKNIYNIVNELQSDIVHLKVTSNNWMDVVSGKSRFKIMGIATDDFPNLPTAEGDEVGLDVKGFVEMIDKVSYAMSNDETRYALNGIYIESITSGGRSSLRLVATDGHRLSYCQRPLKEGIKLPKVILPKKGVWEIGKILKDVEGEFKAVIGEKTFSVGTKTATLVCRLIDGQFPPYEQIIPKEQTKVVTVDKNILIQALRRVVLVANEKSKGVKFSFSPGNLDISSSNPDIGEAKEELSCVYKGETFETGFNAVYFLDILNVLEDERVVLELKNDTSPCVIRSEFDKGFLSVVMPMRL